MLGLAVLFGLAVWVAITIGAVFLGAKALKIWWAKPYAGLLGGFLGFMLTMGGFIVYWAVEYIQIQRTVTHLCETEGGITVYVTPEEWRKQIGEEEWKKSFYTGELDEDYPSGNKMKFNNKVYRREAHINQRIDEYVLDGEDKYHGINIYDKFYYDTKLQKVIYYYRSFSTKNNLAIANDLAGLKFWLKYQGCSFDNQTIYTDYVSNK